MEYVEGGETVPVYVKGIQFRRVIEYGCASIGDTIGSAIPGLGTIAGAAVGRVFGGLLGYWFADATTGHLNKDAYYFIGNVWIPGRTRSFFI